MDYSYANEATPQVDTRISDHDDTLIFDIGVNAGEDTSFYLEKGFRVIGVEANPRIYAQLQIKFAEAIAAGSLILLNIGIWNQEATLAFYVNLDNDHWSSFDPAYGCRQNSRYEVIEVPCMSIRSLIAQHGIPRYLKVDIEGGDKLVLADLMGLIHLPPIISVEEFGNKTVPKLFDLGYRKFKIVPQRTKEDHKSGDLKEGFYVNRVFTGLDSGVFGLDLGGDWLDYDQALIKFRKYVRTSDGKSAGDPNEWYDVHAIIDEASLIPSSSIRWLWMLAERQRSEIEQSKTALIALTSDSQSVALTQTEKLEATTQALRDEQRLRMNAEKALEATSQSLQEEQRVRIDAIETLESTRRVSDEERRLRANAEELNTRHQRRIIEMDSRVANQEEELRFLRAELDAIRSSRTWRLFNPYRQLRKRFSAG